MNVKEMILCLKEMPQEAAVMTHPAGVARWMESGEPRLRPIDDEGHGVPVCGITDRLVVTIV